MQLNLADIQLPLTLRPSAELTDEELMRFSEENRPYKIERNHLGEITIMTPVGGIGSRHEAYVAGSLFAWAGKDGRGISFVSNAGFNLPDGSCLSPDAAWLSLARWNALSEEEQAGYPPLCPEFIVEIRSRSDSRRLLEAKMLLWMDNGAELAWMIDPVDGDLTIYRPGQKPERLERPAVVVGSGPVAGFELQAGELWS
jgi:Uma2 family endonuclease